MLIASGGRVWACMNSTTRSNVGSRCGCVAMFTVTLLYLSMHYNSIEIGTSDFGTLISSANGNGISVEPIPYYFDRLPRRDGWYRVNCAISDKCGSVTAYYCDTDHLDKYPNWIRGCNSIGTVHPTLIEVCKPEHIVSQQVEAITISELYKRYSVESVDNMKIDTEGHDLIIVNDLLDSDLPIPLRLQFESNVLMNRSHYIETVAKLRKYYKTIRATYSDTYCSNRY